MKLDAKNDPAIREFEGWVKDELHGKYNEQPSTTQVSETVSESRCVKCGRTSTEVHRLHYLSGTPTGCNHEWADKPPAPRAGERERVEHSSLPWSIGRNDRVEAANGRVVADMTFSSHSERRAPANARLIVECVNQHATLVAQRDQLLQIARDALQDRIEMNGHCNHDEYMVKLCSQCEIRQLLATIEQKDESR